MKKLKLTTPSGKKEPILHGVFPEHDFESILDMADAILESHIEKLIKEQIYKVADHIAAGIKSGKNELDAYNVILNIGIPLAAVVETLERSQNRPMAEEEILEIGFHIGSMAAVKRRQMEGEMNIAKDMLLAIISSSSMSASKAAEVVLKGRQGAKDAIEKLKNKNADLLEEMAKLFKKPVN